MLLGQTSSWNSSGVCVWIRQVFHALSRENATHLTHKSGHKTSCSFCGSIVVGETYVPTHFVIIISSVSCSIVFVCNLSLVCHFLNVCWVCFWGLFHGALDFARSLPGRGSLRCVPCGLMLQTKIAMTFLIYSMWLDHDVLLNKHQGEHTLCMNRILQQTYSGALENRKLLFDGNRCSWKYVLMEIIFSIRGNQKTWPSVPYIQLVLLVLSKQLRSCLLT